MSRKIVIEKREGVILKGIGKQTTYLIYPQCNSPSNEDINTESPSNSVKNDSIQYPKSTDQNSQQNDSLSEKSHNNVVDWAREIELNRRRKGYTYLIEPNECPIYYTKGTK